MSLQQPNMRLVVFGGGGTIGQPIVAEALSRNHYVLAADPFPDRIPLENPNLDIVKTDVCSVDGNRRTEQKRRCGHRVAQPGPGTKGSL